MSPDLPTNYKNVYLCEGILRPRVSSGFFLIGNEPPLNRIFNIDCATHVGGFAPSKNLCHFPVQLAALASLLVHSFIRIIQRHDLIGISNWVRRFEWVILSILRQIQMMSLYWCHLKIFASSTHWIQIRTSGAAIQYLLFTSHQRWLGCVIFKQIWKFYYSALFVIQ